MKKKNRNKKKGYRSSKRNGYSRHHKCPKSRGGTNDEKNIYYMKDNQHRAFHIVFSNQLPHEQYKTLTAINNPTVNQNFVSDLFELLEKYKNNFYIRGVMKWLTMIRNYYGYWY